MREGRPDSTMAAEGRGSRRTVVVLLAIYAAAWVLRFLYVRHLEASPLTEVPMLDELYHVEWADALAGGDWIGTEAFFRAPLYPYFLGFAFVLFKGSHFAARILQISYGALIPIATYFLGRRVFGARVGTVAAVVAAIYPFFIYFDHEFLIVSLIVLLDLVLLLALLRADDVPSWGRWVLAGAVMGLSAIARPNILIFAPLVLVWIWLGARKEKQALPVGKPTKDRVTLLRGRTSLATTLLRFAVFVLGVVLVVGPITMRNHALSKDFVPIASQGGVNFFIGNNAESDGASAVIPSIGETWRYEDAVRIAEFDARRALKPSEVSDHWYRKGRAFILGTPGAAAKLYVEKFVRFWNSHELANNKDIYHFGRMSPIFRGLSWLHFGVIAPLGFLGMWVWTRKRRGSLLMTFFVVSYMSGVILFFVNARFRLPVVAVMVLFAAAGAAWLIERFAKRETRAFAVGAVAVAVLAFLLNFDFYPTQRGERSQTYYTIGLARGWQGRYQEAIEHYRHAIELSPGYARAYHQMGLTFEQLERDDEALEAYRTAAGLDPGFASPFNNIGILHWEKGEHEEAARWFAQALTIDPYLAKAHYNLAMMMVNLDDLEVAEDHFKSAVIADRGFKEAWNSLGRLFEQTDRPPRAIDAYTRAVMLDPSYTEARNNLAIVLARTGQYEEALMELEEARRRDPDNADVLANIRQVRELVRARQNEAPGQP